jgi:TRAP-type uncharacterized transport system substrate-binding protein
MKNLILVLALIALPAQAQQLKVATGSPTGTYSKMLKEASALCGSSVALMEQNTSGSMENVNLLTGNQVNGAFVQTDVLSFRAKTEDLGSVKTLVTLHPEEVHLYVPESSGIKSGGMVGIGGTEVQFRTIKDLAGYKVGAAGGGFITAQVIRLQAEVAFSVAEYPDNKALLAALAANQIQAALFVGGSPLGVISEAKSGRLLSFPEDVVTKLKAVYRPARINYANIRQMGVTTVATDALFVTREYKTAKFTEALSKLRECIYGHIDELKETTGMHPKWQAVDPENRGKWVYYELPTTAVATPAAKPPVKK